jgi:hypothetical protein
MMEDAEGADYKLLSAVEVPMSSMARMAVFVVLGSALTVGALMVASYLSTTAG